MAKYNVKLNSLEKIEQLLQETYDLATKQIVHIQDEINKLTNSSPLADSTMDEKAKYAKAMHDFMVTVIRRLQENSRLLNLWVRF